MSHSPFSFARKTQIMETVAIVLGTLVVVAIALAVLGALAVAITSAFSR